MNVGLIFKARTYNTWIAALAMVLELSDLDRKHCEKRRKCWLLAFSPFLIVFPKVLSVMVVKTLGYALKVQLNHTIPTLVTGIFSS